MRQPVHSVLRTDSIAVEFQVAWHCLLSTRRELTRFGKRYYCLWACESWVAGKKRRRNTGSGHEELVTHQFKPDGLWGLESRDRGYMHGILRQKL